MYITIQEVELSRLGYLCSLTVHFRNPTRPAIGQLTCMPRNASCISAYGGRLMGLGFGFSSAHFPVSATITPGYLSRLFRNHRGGAMRLPIGCGSWESGFPRFLGLCRRIHSGHPARELPLSFPSRFANFPARCDPDN